MALRRRGLGDDDHPAIEGVQRDPSQVMGRQIGVHALPQDREHCGLTDVLRLCSFEALVAVGDLVLTTLQGTAALGNPHLERSHPSDQVERDSGQVERGVALVNPPLHLAVGRDRGSHDL